MDRYPLLAGNLTAQGLRSGCLKPETGEVVYDVSPCPPGYEPFFSVDAPGNLPACGLLCLFLAVVTVAAAFGD